VLNLNMSTSGRQEFIADAAGVVLLMAPVYSFGSILTGRRLPAMF
jgi:hypothetical protein